LERGETMVFSDGLKVLAAVAALGAAAPAMAVAGSAYEGAYIAGGGQLLGTFFRVNVSSGQVVSAYGAPANYTVISDAGPLPAGDYHLYPVSQPMTPDGKIWWSLARMDGKTGRIWVLTGGGSSPFAWVEAAPPK